MNVRSPLRLCLLVVTFSLASTFAMAQASNANHSADWHLSSAGAKAFFTRSCLAHGYMHGYEEGFYQGDMDLQFGRHFQSFKNQVRFRKVRGYQAEFGERKNFSKGYRKGYAVGYIDAFSGRSFRAMQLVEQAKSDGKPDAEARPDEHFDEVFLQGYELGQKAGLQDGRSATPVLAVDPKDCGQKRNGGEADYCDAYQSGYRLGYSDGFANQRERAPQFAKK